VILAGALPLLEKMAIFIVLEKLSIDKNYLFYFFLFLWKIFLLKNIWRFNYAW